MNTPALARHAAGSPELLTQVRGDGYVVIPGAIPAVLLAQIRERWDALFASDAAETRAQGRHIEVKRILERDPVIAALMDLPTVFPLARNLIGADVTLASGGEGDCRPPRTPAHIGWHSDFQWMVDVPYPRQNSWVRCTYLIEDVAEDMGPFTLLPGTHRSDGPPPADCNGPDGQPRELPGMVRITGRGGDCLVNDTEIWHTATPNRSDRPRKLVMVLYKHAWMRPWDDGYAITSAFAEVQTDPLRRQLCGCGHWHRTDGRWAAA